MTSRLTTHSLSEPEYAEWNRLVQQSPQGMIYSTPEYLSTLCEAAGGSFRILAVRRGDECLGGIGLYEVPTPAGRMVSPRLLLYFNGIVLRNYETKYPSQRTSRFLQIMEALETELAGSGYARLAFKNHPTLTDVRLFQDRGWNVIPTYTYVVPLQDLSVLWGRMEQNLRRFVNRCTEAGVVLSEDEDFDDFFQMHTQTVERKRASLYLPRPSFQRYFEKLGAQNLARLFHARLPNGRAIACQLVLLGQHPWAHTVAAAADEEFLHLGANAFLRWKVFEKLSGWGYLANDLTDAALNPITHFKGQLGGDLQMCFQFERPDKPLYRIYRVGCELAEHVRGGIGALARRLALRKRT